MYKFVKYVVAILSIILTLLVSMNVYADSSNELKISIGYIYNKENNTIEVTMTSNNILKDTKPTWKLSEDKLVYTKTFDNEDKTYSTPVEDIYGNKKDILIEIKKDIANMPLKITMEYKTNEDGTITAIIHSNKQMANTKPTWKLSADKLTYTKIYNQEEKYYTTVEDIYGNKIDVLIEIKKDIANIPLKVTMEYKTNADGTITAIMHSNKPMANTKPTWKLSADKLTYSKVYDKSEDYYTEVRDTYGNIVNVHLEIKVKLVVKIEYEYNEKTNKVTVKLVSNNSLANTKPTWNLVNDMLYIKEYSANERYTTQVEDIYGNKVTVEINITQILDKTPPEITVEYITNTDGTITAIMHSNEPLGDTKPTWKLSSDRLSYSKTFSESINYTTPVEDIYGNSIDVKITIKINKKIQNYTSIDESAYPGFKEALQKLKNAHPNWNIKVYYTNINWEDFINEEDKIIGGSPRSLTQAPYLYEWAKGDEKYDVSQSWYRATKSAIRYMTDARNSLDEAWFFQFQDLSSSSGTKEEIKKMVQGTFLNTDSAINAILEAAREQGISPFHLVSRIVQEQRADGSGIMNGYKYLDKTVYNLFNINVSGNVSTGILAGARYAYDRGWYTPEASIKGGAEFLTKNYISKGQSTLYFQKYNVVNEKNLYGNQYMQNIRAANDEGNMIYKSYKNSGILDSHFEFIVPLYEKMPTSACPRPKN